MRSLLPFVLLASLVATSAAAKGPKSGNPVVTRAAIAVDNARYDDAIKQISKLRKDLRSGAVTLDAARHGKALWLLASAHRARAQEPQNHSPTSDLVQAMDATLACEALAGAEEHHESCGAVAQEVGTRLYARLLQIAAHGLDAPLTTDDLAEASDIRLSLQRGEPDTLRPSLGEAWYRASTQAPEEADAAALAGLELAKVGPVDVGRAIELASLQARTRAFALGDVDSAVDGISAWKAALPAEADTSALDALSSTLAASAEKLTAARAAAEAGPADVKAQVAYTELLDTMAQHRDAAAWWKQATAANPDIADMWYRRGVYHTNRAAFMQKGGAPYASLKVPLLDAAEAFDGCLAAQPDHASCTKHKLTVKNYLEQLQ